MGARISFQTTRWSIVRQAVGRDDIESRRALAVLCEGYWYPIYAFIRRSGRSPQDAEDLTQGFFELIIEKDVLASADPAKGRLRTFLLACVRNFVADAYDREQAHKRGAGLVVSFDAAQAEERYVAEPVDELSPDRLFHRRWALTLVSDTLGWLREEWTNDGKAELFEALRPFLGLSPKAEKSYEQLSLELGMAEGTLKSHVHRLRERWRDALFEKVAATLDRPTPREIQAELSVLLECL